MQSGKISGKPAKKVDYLSDESCIRPIVIAFVIQHCNGAINTNLLVPKISVI